jgi:plastocyanin
MARGALVAALSAGGAALAASATSGAAGTSGGSAGPAANKAPVASRRANHRRPRVGQKVVLDSSRSRDPDGRIVYHLWDLDGDGVYERNSGPRARIKYAFKKAGKVRVAVVVVDDQGAYSVRRARLRAVGDTSGNRRARRGRGARRHRARVHAATRHDLTDEKGPPARKPSPPRAVHSAASVVHAAAASNSVTITDFKYEPKSITVSVGDTVVWTNDGPTAHSATADDGTFDTGNLTKGVTGSYKFTKAGKYSYHCTPHPFMKASVTVTGTGGSSSPDSSSNGSSGNGSSSSKSSSLPHTGLQIASMILTGFALLAAGAVLRRRLTRP